MTIRQDCIRWAQHRGVNLSGSELHNGICVSGSQNGQSWVTAFDTWKEVYEFFKEARDCGSYVLAIRSINSKVKLTVTAA